ncbi:MAG: hypothetical protein HOO67_00430 [Candidatus Peribacteraceae bacterium]|nr:hypothetical protein [Candidatus Peribacteraceae bacterium]
MRILRVHSPLCIHQKNRENCPINGCGKPTKGKPYCPKHMAIGERRKLPNDLRARILSGCCNAPCVSGEQHDSGEQYCTKCKEACNWKAGPSGASKSATGLSRDA